MRHKCSQFTEFSLWLSGLLTLSKGKNQDRDRFNRKATRRPSEEQVCRRPAMMGTYTLPPSIGFFRDEFPRPTLGIGWCSAEGSIRGLAQAGEVRGIRTAVDDDRSGGRGSAGMRVTVRREGAASGLGRAAVAPGQ